METHRRESVRGTSSRRANAGLTILLPLLRSTPQGSLQQRFRDANASKKSTAAESRFSKHDANASVVRELGHGGPNASK